MIVDKAGYEYLWPGEPVRLGREFEISDRRGVLVGVCKASPPFVTLPVLYTRFNEAQMYVPARRNLMNYVLAEPMPGEDSAVVAAEHHAAPPGFWPSPRMVFSGTRFTTCWVRRAFR